jgi:hypothetical protein
LLEDDNHIFRCAKRKNQRKNIIKHIKYLRKTVNPILCNILKEGLMTYFKGESLMNAILRIRGTLGHKRYDLLIDEQIDIGWNNI